MKYKRFFETFFLLAIILISTSLANETTAFGNDKTIVFTSVPPIAYFIERIGGNEVQVESLIGPKDDPHAFEPKPRQMVSLSKARIYFSTNFPFETNILSKIKSSNPDLLVVDISLGATSMEDHDEKCQGSDPHIWTSPLVA
ncbi:MAG: zinc ABC transporter substrate-binding protein, partial [Acetomicrobium sp.]